MYSQCWEEDLPHGRSFINVCQINVTQACSRSLQAGHPDEDTFYSSPFRRNVWESLSHTSSHFILLPNQQCCVRDIFMEGDYWAPELTPTPWYWECPHRASLGERSLRLPDDCGPQVPAELGASGPPTQNCCHPVALSVPAWDCSLRESLKRKSMWSFLVPQAEGRTSRVFCSWPLTEAGRAPSSHYPSPPAPSHELSVRSFHKLSSSFVLGVNENLLKCRYIKKQFSISSNK